MTEFWTMKRGRAKRRMACSCFVLFLAHVVNPVVAQHVFDDGGGGEDGGGGHVHDETQFPVAKIENVYESWKPVDHGHPLRDVTLYYSPPTLERVKIMEDPNAVNRRRSAGHARSGESLFQPVQNLVIPATPKREPKNTGYSVYGSPDINYSALYSNPDQPRPSHRTPFPSSLSGLFSSAALSRSADDLPALPRVDLPRHQRSQGGGIQYIDPPNKKSNEYYYYTEDSPRYNNKLSIKPPVLQKKHEEIERRLDNLPESSQASPTFVKPPPVFTKPSSSANQNAVIYSFRNNFGQKQKIGVVYDQDDLDRPQLNNNIVTHQPQVHLKRPLRRRIPFGSTTGFHSPPTRAPEYEEPTHRELVSGDLNYVHHGRQKPIPLKRVPTTSRQQSFPLGNPYGTPSVHSRPNFFPAQKHPPIYRVRPNKLEGVFGPALPPKPEPTHLNFHDEEDDLQPGNRQVRRDDVLDQQVVYKTVRDMDYARPSVILHVKESGELFVPDEKTLNPIVQPDPPSTLINTPVEELWRQKQGETLSVRRADDIDGPEGREAQWLPDFSDAYEDHQSQTYPELPSQAPSHQGLDDQSEEDQQKPSFAFPTAVPDKLKGGVRPFSFQNQNDKSDNKPRPIRQSINSVTTTSHPAPAPDASPVTPNYKFVVGASYDSNPAKGESKEEPNEFSKKELYELCIKEVPEYLRQQLCDHIIKKRPEARLHEVKDLHQPSIDTQKVEQLNQRRRQLIANRRQGGSGGLSGIPMQIPKQTRQRSPAVKRPSVVANKSRVKLYSQNKAITTTTTTTTAAPTTTTTPVTTTTTTTTTASTTSSVTQSTTSSAPSSSPTSPQRKRIRPPSPFLQGLAAFFKQTLSPRLDRRRPLEPPKPSEAEASRTKNALPQDDNSANKSDRRR